MRRCINDLKSIIRVFVYALCNLFFYLLGLIIRRDDSIVLVGAWMGKRFADNSRFLFQFLSENKKECLVKRVIWVCRDDKLVYALQSLGYEAYRIGTISSMYWHLKAGVHIICNVSAKSGRHLPDIDVKYSSGAKKIQLWHGVGIKAVGAMANASQNSNTKRSRWLSQFFNKESIRRIGSLGGWAEPKILCTSELNIDINIRNSRIHRNNAFISGYPRYCDCLLNTKEELNVIKRIEGSCLSVLYLPTFRDKGSVFTHPLDSHETANFIAENGILWIEKPHQAETNEYSNHDMKNIIYLDSMFDVNVLLKYVDIIISDYSSAAFDAIYLKKPVIMYVPDLDDYERGNNGLLFNMREYCAPLLVFGIDDLIKTIKTVKEGEYFSQERINTLNRMRRDFFGEKEHNYKSIWEDIRNASRK